MQDSLQPISFLGLSDIHLRGSVTTWVPVEPTLGPPCTCLIQDRRVNEGLMPEEDGLQFSPSAHSLPFPALPRPPELLPPRNSSALQTSPVVRMKETRGRVSWWVGLSPSGYQGSPMWLAVPLSELGPPGRQRFWGQRLTHLVGFLSLPGNLGQRFCFRNLFQTLG